MKTLTNQQKRVYDYIVSHRKEKGYPPTVEEIAEAIGTVKSTAYVHMVNVEKKGYIKLMGKPRAIVIIGGAPVGEDDASRISETRQEAK